MAIKLSNPKTSDFYTSMPLRLRPGGEVLKDQNDVEGYIEFWHTEAKPIKETLRKVTAQLYAISEKKQRAKGVKELTAQEAEDELKKIEDLSIEALAIRVKDWHLVNENGDHIDAPATKENAVAILGDPEAEINGVATDWCSNSENFTLKHSRRTSKASKTTVAQPSKGS